MLPRHMIPALLLGASALAALSPAALAAPPVGDATTPPAMVVIAPQTVTIHTLYDRVADPITAAIRQALIDAGKEGAFLEKRDAAAVAEYYAERAYAPSWTANGVLTDRAKAIIKRIWQADTDGLDPRNYPMPSLFFGEYKKADAKMLAEAEVMLSGAIATFARHASNGRLDPNSLSPNISYQQHLPDPIGVLSKIASASDPIAALDDYNPKHSQFIALREKLAEVRAKAAEDKPIVIPAGPNLKLGMADPRVVLIRQRFGLPTDVDSPDVYDESVLETIKVFQQASKLKADGILGKGTLSVINRAADDHIGTILANMERWRWMPKEFGSFYVQVSVPDYTLTIFRDGKPFHSTRIVVGKPSQQTPIFSDQIEHVIVNPVWNVPASIAVKEMLPQIQRNPGALRGYQVYANIGGRFRAVDPFMVDWHTVDMRRIQIKQPPGERNALGSIKFMFPNQFAVYLHDTPSKSLFEREARAFSHGCMRVMDPWAFAQALLANEHQLTAGGLKKMVGGREKKADLTYPVPVHITYFTASVDESGELQIRDDIYGHDQRIEKAFDATAGNS